MNWRPIVRNLQTYLPASLHSLCLDFQQWHQLRSGKPHESEFLALRGLLRPGAHVLDVGANRGQSIDGLHMIDRTLRITAFEPQRVLAWRLMFRYPNVDVRQIAVGDRPGKMALYTPSYRGYRFDGLASTDRDTATAWFPYSMWRYRPELVTVDTEQIRVIVLDHIHLDRVDLIRFNVQGMELAALRGAQRLLRRDHPLLMLETPGADVIDWLQQFGYRLFHIAGEALVPPAGAWATNALFRAA